jgi:hypothetical protein
VASLDAIAVALAKTIEDYTEDELTVYAYPADSGHVPAVVVGETGGNYRQDMGAGWIDWQFEVAIILPRVELSESVPTLRRMISGTGPNSIPELLLQHPDLGLADGTDVTVTDVRAGTVPNWNSIPYIGAILSVRVITDGRA